MPKLPRTSSRRIGAVLLGFGFVRARVRGSHAVLRRGERICVLPLHDMVAPGTLRSVPRQAGIEPEAFIERFEA